MWRWLRPHRASAAERGPGALGSAGEHPQPGQLGKHCIYKPGAAGGYRLYQICSCLQTSSGYNHTEASLFHFIPFFPPQEHVAKKDSLSSSELWYSTVSHDVKHEVSVIDSNNHTEYALISVPKRKANVTNPEEHSEYDDVLVT